MKNYIIVLVALLFAYKASAQTLPKLIPFRNGDKWGYVDTAKNMVIPFIYEDASPFLKEGYALVKDKGKLVYIDEKGTIVSDPKVVKSFRAKLAGVEKISKHEGKYGIVDTLGNVIVPYQYDFIIGFNESGLAAVRKDKKCGFINEKGEVVIPLKYEDVGVFWSNQITRITINKKDGYIDINGNEYFTDSSTASVQ